MNHFKGKQFQKDVIIVAVGYYLRYNLSYRDVQEILCTTVVLTCLTPLSIVGYRNMGNYFTTFGRGKTNSPFIRGKWTRPILKSKENGIIFIAPLMQMVSLWIYGYGKSKIHKQLTPFSRD